MFKTTIPFFLAHCDTRIVLHIRFLVAEKPRYEHKSSSESSYNTLVVTPSFYPPCSRR